MSKYSEEFKLKIVKEHKENPYRCRKSTKKIWCSSQSN